MKPDLKYIINNLSAMIGYWDTDLRNLYANQAYASWFGLTPSQIHGKHIRDVIGEERFQLNLPYIQGALRGEEQEFEREIPAPDGGGIRHSFAKYQPDFADGKVCGFTALVSDISLIKHNYSEMEGYSRYLKVILDNLFTYVALLDTQGVVLEVNKAPLIRAGFQREDVIGKYFFDAPWWTYDVDVRNKIIQSISAAKQGETSRFEIEAKMGTEIQPLDFLISPVRDERGNIVAILPTAVDISIRKRAENDLKIAATAFDAKVGILVTDADCKILRINRSFTDGYGYSPEEMIGQHPRMLRSGKHAASFYNAMWESIIETGSWEGEIWDRRKNGEIFPKWLNITAIKNEKGIVTNYVSTHTDITERKLAEEEIKHLAFYDPLTDLPNRRLLLDRIKQAMASFSRTGKAGAILFMDLDNFKTLNDTLGHGLGDLLLIQVANRLISSVREGDTVARLGGDEFVVMLEDLSENSIEAAAQTESIGGKILAAINQPFQLSQHEYLITPSIGAIIINDQSASIDDLLKHADIAMYQAKKSGRNALRFFDPDMQNTINARVAIENDLIHGLDHSEFKLYYQVQTNHLQQAIGAEALIRWLHPRHGLVSPAVFIPLAEENGLIIKIGLWVLNSACEQLKLWERKPSTKNLELAINVSAKQIHQDNFVSQVKVIILQHNINPNRLKLELTESMLVENIEETILKICELKALGIGFSLDDFGTGYSSLQYLKRLPISQLKIDQSFVRDIEVDSHDRSIVRTVIAMAKSLDLEVIAEGVETEKQRQLLLNKGCTSYQGYLFGKPVTIDEFEASLKL